MRHVLLWNCPRSVSCIVLLLAALMAASPMLMGCGAERHGVSQTATAGIGPLCTVSQVRYPTTRDDFYDRVYDNRVFYAPSPSGPHLGYDIRLSEGKAVHPIACGVIRFFGSAVGYGMLTVVVEHLLPHTINVRNGKGEMVTVTSFLSVYGHLRPTELLHGGLTLGLRVGDTVVPDDVIGFVQNNAFNGDGAEHLHLGIRLQTMDDAKTSDAAWFRGYDDPHRPQARWFADPADFLSALMANGLSVRWHPPGTVITEEGRLSTLWMIGEGDRRRFVAPTVAKTDHLTNRTITVSREEFDCFGRGDDLVAELDGARVFKFDDASAVYELNDGLAAGRYTFISYDAFVSWGWRDADILVLAAKDRNAFFARYPDRGFRRLRDGTLVKARGQSEVSVVSSGRHLPIFSWQAFVALGYDAKNIVEVDPATLKDVAFPRGPTITPETIAFCADPIPCFNDGCDAGSHGGGLGPDDPTDLAMTLPDMGVVPDMMVVHDMAPMPDMTVLSDLSVPPDIMMPPDLAMPRPPPPEDMVRYEFRVDDAAGWQADEPFTLYNQDWLAMFCRNTGTTKLEAIAGGWHRCDMNWPLTPFVGNFFSKAHPDWGFKGNLATVGNFPQHCTPTPGVSWRLTDLTKNKVFFNGSVADLVCVTKGMYDFHVLPALP